MYTYTLSMIQHHTVLRSGLPYTTVGEVRNLPPPARELRGREGRDSYVVVALDSEEIFRTVTAEKTLRWVCVCVCTCAKEKGVMHTCVIFLVYFVNQFPLITIHTHM